MILALVSMILILNHVEIMTPMSSLLQLLAAPVEVVNKIDVFRLNKIFKIAKMIVRMI